jgi:glutaredoxin 3
VAEVIVYSTEHCGFCVRAKDLLERRGIAFTEVMVDRDPEQRAIMEQRCGGCRTVPQIFIGETHVGGYRELSQLDRDGKLEGLAAAAPTAAR